MKKSTIFQTKLTFLFIAVLFISLGAFANNPGDTEGTGDTRMKIRLNFNSVNGFDRNINLIADENATSGFDIDFDVALDNIEIEDMYWLIDNVKFLNQGINDINDDTVLSLGIHTITSGLNIISINKIDNIPTDMGIYLHDTALGVFHSIKDGPYEINLNAGLHLNRFEIVFAQPETLGTSEVSIDKNNFRILFDRSTDEIKVLNHTNVNIETVEVYSLLGQSVNKIAFNAKNDFRINATNLRNGTYIVMVKSENSIISKKILVN